MTQAHFQLLGWSISCFLVPIIFCPICMCARISISWFPCTFMPTAVFCVYIAVLSPVLLQLGTTGSSITRSKSFLHINPIKLVLLASICCLHFPACQNVYLFIDLSTYITYNMYVMYIPHPTIIIYINNECNRNCTGLQMLPFLSPYIHIIYTALCM